jgi:transposase
MPDKRRIYTEEFKREAVRLVTDQGYGMVEAARNLGLNASMLGRWKREVEQTMNGAFPGNGRVSLDQEEVHWVREENKRLRMERNILKKPWASLPASRREICLHHAAPGDVADCGVV